MVFTSDILPDDETLNTFAARGQYLIQVLVLENQTWLYFQSTWNGAQLVTNRFEYQVIMGSNLPESDDISHIITSGWELVQIVPVGDMCIVYIRRQISTKGPEV